MTFDLLISLMFIDPTVKLSVQIRVGYPPRTMTSISNTSVKHIIAVEILVN